MAAHRRLTWAAVAGGRVGQVMVGAMRLPRPTMLALGAFALALGACGALHSVQDPDARADAMSSARPAPVPALSAQVRARTVPVPSRPAPALARPAPARIRPVPPRPAPVPSRPPLSANASVRSG